MKTPFFKKEIENKSKKELDYLAEVDSYLLEINELRGNLGTAIESKNIALKSQEQATEKQEEIKKYYEDKISRKEFDHSTEIAFLSVFIILFSMCIYSFLL